MSERLVFEGIPVWDNHGIFLNESGEDYDYQTKVADSYKLFEQFMGQRVRVTVEVLE